MFTYIAVIMQDHGDSSLGSFDECRLSAKRPPTLRLKPTDLGCVRL